MTTVGKLIRLFFLLILLGVIVVAALLQVPQVQQEMKGLVVQKVSSQENRKLSIQKVEGIFPFRMTLYGVNYSSPAYDASFEKVKATINPFSLLLKRISFVKLVLKNGKIQTKSGNGSYHPGNPFPIPILIHSLKVDHLQFNEIRDIHLTGIGEFDDAFLLQLDVRSDQLPDTDFHAAIDGNWESGKVTIMSQIKGKVGNKNPSDFNFWANGEFNLAPFQFEGTLIGNIQSQEKIDFSSNLKMTHDGMITFSPLTIQTPQLGVTSLVCYNLKTKEIFAKGKSADFPFRLTALLNLSKEEISLSYIEFLSDESKAQGYFSYHFSNHDYYGNLQLFPRLTDSGVIEGNIQFSNHQAQFQLFAHDLIWKTYSLNSFQLSGDWIKGQTLKFDLRADYLDFLEPEYEVFPTLHFDLQGEMENKRLLLIGNAWGLGDVPFTLQAELPIQFNISPFSLKMDRYAPFALQTKGAGSIDPLLAFLENASLIARGSIDLNLGIHGTLEDPQITGFLNFINGNVESLVTGAVYRDIQMEMIGSGKEFQIQNLHAHDFARGELSGSGSIIFDYKSSFPFVLNLQAHRYTLIATDPFTANVNAELVLSGNMHQMYFSGQASIVEGYLSVPNKMPVQVPVIEVTYANPIPCLKPQSSHPKKNRFIPVHVDINVEARDNLIIEGRELISEWRGNMHITGEQNALQYHGKLKLVQGRFNVVGRSFDLTEGQIQIEGLTPKQIMVDLRGDYELSHLTATIHIRGSLADAKLSFTSAPPMSTNQILSWILFNQDVNELTPFQACRLANIMVSLSGKYTGSKVFEGIKEGLGIDVFNITHCDIDAADFTFQVGKYISQGTFVGINKSLSGDTDSVLIQTRLYRDFFLEANYGGSLNGLTPNGGKIIFKWYKSY